MKLVARAVTALALLALATPALPCGFDKPHNTTTTTSAPPTAATGPVAKAEKQKPAKTEKAKAPTASKATASN